MMLSFFSCLLNHSVMSSSVRPHSLPGSSVHQILQAKFWNEKPFPYPGDLPNPGVKLGSPESQPDSLPAELPGKPLVCIVLGIK